MSKTDTCFHFIDTDIAIEKILNNPFDYQPNEVSLWAIHHLKNKLFSAQHWLPEIVKGKMFGVLVVENESKQLGYLAAYSGQIGGKSDWEGFVPAVFDYLKPDGYFKQQEAIISQINAEIVTIEASESYRKLQTAYENQCLEVEKTLEQALNRLKNAKKKRDDLRQLRVLTTDEQHQLIKESQYQKAEFRRLKQRLSTVLNNQRIAFDQQNQRIATLKAQRKQLSDALQNWLFTQFNMLNARKEQKNLLEIFATTPQVIPPAGAGECCAPKLFQHAFKHNYKPIAVAEFWWGASPRTQIRHHGHCYPACRGKCLPILTFMLQGLEIEDTTTHPKQPIELPIVFEDDYLLVVNKPSGLLSVPGKNNTPSVYSIVRSWFNPTVALTMVHRLDMDTSGLLLLAKTKEAYHHLQAQFKERSIKKQYIAIVCGKVKQAFGSIDLPLSPDYIDRPRQIVDMDKGKKALTFFQVLQYHHGKTLLAFQPQTGRTHQLRVHCAHENGLNCPIVGDALYGFPADRLYLHAAEITFIHPITQCEIKLKAPLPQSFRQFFNMQL